MSASDELFGPGRQRAFAPFLAPTERKELNKLLRLGEGLPSSFASELRVLAKRFVDDSESAKLRAICLLVADLFEQGWRVAVQAGNITVEPPGIARDGEQSIEDVKTRVRQGLQSARLRQLQEPSVQRFLARMERRTKRPEGRFSVLDLIDNGATLANAFARIATVDPERRAARLAKIVDPVIEVCGPGAKCPDTGLSLIDVWRYFRHTWAHEYRPIPGRQVLVLIRNAARPRRPVMGIAMLASPVMRLGARDAWIGWTREAAEANIREGRWESAAFLRNLQQRLTKSIRSIRWDDLCSKAEVAKPTERVSLRLDQKAAGAAFAREDQLKAHYKKHRKADGKVQPHRGNITEATRKTDWRKASKDLLFVRKRAETLSQLLFAKRIFQSLPARRNPAAAIDTLFGTADGQRALDIVLAEFRKAGLSSEVADVSICGAVHPYNALLGGKLVALMLTTKEMREAYAKRYGGQISFIASQMAGKAVKKPANLRVLTTTSLYGVGSSQYNRLELRAKDFPALPHDVRWGAIGKSLTGGFGTLHLGSETAHALRTMALTRHDARRVNNRFGEGTSPRLRQIREGLDALGLQSSSFLHHATPRLFYGCELDPGSRYALLGFEAPKAIDISAADMADAWRRRWLSNRVLREETIATLRTLGVTSILASLHADADGQFLLPIEGL